MSILDRIHAAQRTIWDRGFVATRLETSADDYRTIQYDQRIANGRWSPSERFYLVTDYGTLEVVPAKQTAVCWREREPRRLEVVGWNRKPV